MSELASGDNILYTCNICKETYNNLVNFTEHNKMHINIEKEADMIEKTTIKKRRRKKKSIKYCNICCKTFASAGSCYIHMRNYHDKSSLSEYVPFKKNLPTSTPKHIEKTNENVCKIVGIEDIFIEFENKLPLELRCDKCRCILCDTIFEDTKDYVDHEKMHYQVEVQVPIDEITTLNTDSNAVFDAIICSMCHCIFTTNIDYEEHKNINCKCVEQVTPIDEKTNILMVQRKEVHEIVYNPPGVIVVEKSEGVQTEDHINACKELYIFQQRFYCEICKDICEIPDHFEINQWWTPPSDYRPFKCCVCFETFSEKNSWKLHEDEHIKTNI